MNILFVLGQLKYSGAENVVRSITPLIADKGHNVSIALRMSCDIQEYKGIRIFCYNGNEITRLKKLKKIVKQQKIDCVVSFGVPYNFDCAILHLMCKTKVILCERHDPASINRTKKQKLLKKILYPLVDGYVVQTQRTRDYYLKNITSHSNRVAVIPNPVREVPDYCVAEEQRCKEVVTVGRYEDKQKNQTMLIKAFAEFHKSCPDYFLRMYGNGPDIDKYRKLIKELGIESYVDLAGSVQNPLDYIRRADFFCLTSNSEGMPNALIEAMSIGLPCISTDCGGGAPAELIQDGKNGILIPMNDVCALKDAMLKLANDDELKIRLGKEAAKICDRLDLQRIVDLWEKYICYITEL